MKFLPITIGNLYQYKSYTEKVLYYTDPTDVISPEKMDEYHYNSSTYNMIIGEMNHGDMFVPLETKDCDIGVKIPSKLFKILTTTGMIGWVYLYYSDILEVEG